MLLLGIVLLPIGVGVAFLIIAWIRIKSTEIAVTTRRLIVKHGFVRRNTVEINLSKVESIQVDQNVFGRMLDFGTLVISGTGTSHAPIDGIADPMTFRKAFIEAQQESAHEALRVA
jgi:uncharacterized membrane protein YdbT with pleckstrin-like domain